MSNASSLWLIGFASFLVLASACGGSGASDFETVFTSELAQSGCDHDLEDDGAQIPVGQYLFLFEVRAGTDGDFTDLPEMEGYDAAFCRTVVDLLATAAPENQQIFEFAQEYLGELIDRGLLDFAEPAVAAQRIAQGNSFMGSLDRLGVSEEGLLDAIEESYRSTSSLSGAQRVRGLFESLAIVA